MFILRWSHVLILGITFFPWWSEHYEWSLNVIGAMDLWQVVSSRLFHLHHLPLWWVLFGPCPPFLLQMQGNWWPKFRFPGQCGLVLWSPSGLSKCGLEAYNCASLSVHLDHRPKNTCVQENYLPFVLMEVLLKGRLQNWRWIHLGCTVNSHAPNAHAEVSDIIMYNFRSVSVHSILLCHSI